MQLAGHLDCTDMSTYFALLPKPMHVRRDFFNALYVLQTMHHLGQIELICSRHRHFRLFLSNVCFHHTVMRHLHAASEDVRT